MEGWTGEASGRIPRQYNDNVCYIGGRFADVPFIITLCNLIYVTYDLLCVNIKYILYETQWNYKIDKVLIISKFYNFVTLCLKSSSETVRSEPSSVIHFKLPKDLKM